MFPQEPLGFLSGGTHVRDIKPLGQLNIDPNHPFAKGLVSLFMFTEGVGNTYRDHVTGKWFTGTAAASWRMSRWGLVRTQATGTVDVPITTIGNVNANISMASEFLGVGGTTERVILYLGDGTGGSGTQLELAATTGNIQISTALPATLVGGGAQTSGTRYRAVYTLDAANTNKLWVNGTLTSASASPTSVTPTHLLISTFNGTTLPYTGGVLWVAVWNRQLTDNEAQFISRFGIYDVLVEQRAWFPTLGASGVAGINGTLSQTLAALTAAATGTVSVSGALASTLEAVTAATTATVSLSASLATTLGTLTSASTAAVDVTGNLSATLADVTLSATEVTTTNATLSVTLDTLSLSSTGTIDVKGTTSTTLDAVTLAGTSTVDVVASLSSTLAAVTLAATTTVEVKASLSTTLADVALTGTGTVGATGVNGTLAVTLDNLSSTLTGVVEISASLATTLGTLTAAGTGTLAIQGTLTVTLGTLVLDSTVRLSYNGTGSFLSAAASFAASGTTGVASGVTGTGSFTSAAARFRARGKRWRPGGHNVQDLAGYNAFVSQGEKILEELGQKPSPSVPDPVLDIQPFNPPTIRRIRPVPRPVAPLVTAPAPVVVQPIRLKGKPLARGAMSVATARASFTASGGITFMAVGAYGAPAPGILSSGSVDIYYRQRLEEDKLLEDLLIELAMA
jgi:hypothetical protein